MAKIICVDFDGVLHSYSSGWQAADVVSDPPVPGAIQWLADLVEDSRFEPVVYSSRSSQPGGIEAMRDWLYRQAAAEYDDEHSNAWIEEITFPVEKPPAFITIDDRAICFSGSFPPLDEIDGFKPWNK